jgi:tetratricopeptide (TPR) repeat protein
VVGGPGLELALGAHAAGMIRSLHLFLLKAVFPIGLAYEYDARWPGSFSLSREMLLPLCLMGWGIFLAVRRRYKSLFGLCAVFLPLLPYLNVIPLNHGYPGYMVHYDHYMLFSLAVFPVLIMTSEWGNPPQRPRLGAIAVVGAALLIASSLYCHDLSAAWRTKESLYLRNISISPDMPRPYDFLGFYYVTKKQYEKAIPYFLRSRELLPATPRVLAALGDAYAFSGQYAKGEETYKVLLAKDPLNRAVLLNLANCLILQDKFSEARRHISRWAANYPGDSRMLQAQRFLEARQRSW